jgi:uncharacterized protein (DUF2252 family)
VLAQNAMRVPELVPVRHGRMAASPWTYYRGAAAVMAADLASRPHSGLTVQMCGDAHVLNFGLWATPERQLSFDLRDFDETLPGPFEWDVMRMAASLQVLACTEGLTDATRADRAVRAALEGYRAGIARYAEARFLDVWYEQITADDLLSVVVGEERADIAARLHRRARKRSNLGVAKKFTEVVDGRARLIEAPPFRVRDDRADRAAVEEVMAAYRSSLPEERRYLLDRYGLVDVMRQVVGVGSVGMRVYLLVLQGASSDDLLFLQVKQAGPSVYEAHLEPSRYCNHGQRVTVGRRFIQSSTCPGCVDSDANAAWSLLAPMPPPATQRSSTPTSARAGPSTRRRRDSPRSTPSRTATTTSSSSTRSATAKSTARRAGNTDRDVGIITDDGQLLAEFTINPTKTYQTQKRPGQHP